MSTATTGTPGEAQAKIGPMGRIFGALFNPKETFADIARKPSWIAPVALLAVLGLVFVYVMNQRVDWHDYIRHKIEQSPRASQIPPERMSSIVDQQATWSPRIAYVFGCLGALLFALFLGLVYWGAFNLVGGAAARFGQAFAICAHAQLTSLVASPIIILVMYLKERGEVDPENLLASSAAAFLGDDAPRWLHSLASSFELFWFWTLFLLATGFAAVNPKKISLGKSLGIVIGVWLVGVMAKVGWAFLFS